MPESPIYLLKRKKFDELKEVLEKIAEWNGTELGDWESLGLTEEDSVDEKVEDQAENILRLKNLPSEASSDDTGLRQWLATCL